MTDLRAAPSRERLAALYRDTLLEDVMPFWLQNAMDPTHGGIFTSLDESGSLLCHFSNPYIS